MSDTLQRIQALARQGKIRVSEHGYDELAQDGLTAREAVAGLARAVLVEDYPAYPKGPCILTLQADQRGMPIHTVWGIPKGKDEPAVLVTAYRPDQEQWSADFLRRKA